MGDPIKVNLQVLVSKFTSRKFVLAVLGAASLFVAGRKTEAAGVIAAYILGEAHIDAKAIG